MRTQILQKLHEQSINLLRLIEESDKRVDYYNHLFKTKENTTIRNEMELWPTGMPDYRWWDKATHRREISLRANARLKLRYIRLTDKVSVLSKADEIFDSVTNENLLDAIKSRSVPA